MKDFTVDKLRNVGLVGHGGVGKTSLVEGMLFTAGVTKRLGKVIEGNTVSDYNDDEIERKVSINASLSHLEWKEHKINLVDMPGYADFIGEVVGGLRVCESAMVLISALSGIEVGTEQVWNIADKYGVARFVFINKMDNENADFFKVLKQLEERFGQKIVPLQIPSGQGAKFKGIIDLMKMRAIAFNVEGKAQEEAIPKELEDVAKEYRNKLMESVAESDDALLEKFFEKGELSDEEIRNGLRKGVLSLKLFPLLCGNALGNIGSSPLLDYIVEFMPSPIDLGKVKAKKGNKDEVELPIAENGPTCAFAFKTVSEPHVGELTFLKVYSGAVKSGDDLYNPNQSVTERIGQIYAMNGKQRNEVGIVKAGDIGALVKLKYTRTGDTLCDNKNTVILPPIEFPKPVINLAIRGKSKGEEEKIASGLSKLHEEDPTFIMEVDGDIKQTIIYGQGELHLDVIVDRLKKKFGVEVEMEKPRIPYRETIRRKVEVQGKYKRQSGGRGQYGDAWLRLEPLPRGKGFEFASEIFGGSVPSKYIPAVEKGVVEAMNEGVFSGHKMVDIKVVIYDGSYHSVDSSDMAFKIAASMGFKKGCAEANPVLLEPIYNVEVIVPEEFMGDVMGDLSSRRGKILGMEPDGSFQKIKAQVPLAELYKYSTSLRSLTQGRGGHTREFSHYEEVPREIADKIIEESKKEKEEEK